MNLRAPSIPLITVDPYFSVWSPTDKLYDSVPVHWTGKPNTLCGTVYIDGEGYRFMGLSDLPAIEQTGCRINALSTKYKFENEKISLQVTFTTPLLPYDLQLMSRPVSYMRTEWEPLDDRTHDVSISVEATEEFCLNLRGQSPVEAEVVRFDEEDTVLGVRIGNTVQKPLNRSGDDIRIDWGWFYLAVTGENAAVSCGEYKDKDGTMTSVKAVSGGREALFVFAYDDIDSIMYFGRPLKAYWRKGGSDIKEEILRACAAYGDYLYGACQAFSRALLCHALEDGGEEYADLCSLAYRQTCAAHKLVYDENGETLFISKECFSNGCAATVDISYPSMPLFLCYNPELVKGMMRPVFKFARSDDWEFDFAPHDCGQYPLLNGQVYSKGTIDNQMPVEESGNMLLLAAATSIADRDASFAADNMDLLSKWVEYLVEYGEDPGHQLCTDDFAGHLAHNCNLSLKAIMGIVGYAIILDMMGDSDSAASYMEKAREMAASWIRRAANGDGSFRLAFDRPGTWSMKYNLVWDKLFGTNIFPREVIESELASNFLRMNPYGMPLDCRNTYTKSDWLVWVATLAGSREQFREFIRPLWKAYNYMPSRVPMTDWYDTVTSKQIGFQHRAVQGGIYIKLLEMSGKMKYRFKK
ncbi:MAG: DUF4965 domain-containing protein [Clostridiales bacterium]|nr:DUF4965 domain-containing protein [Clostridiales bacterium]